MKCWIYLLIVVTIKASVPKVFTPSVSGSPPVESLYLFKMCKCSGEPVEVWGLVCGAPPELASKLIVHPPRRITTPQFIACSYAELESGPESYPGPKSGLLTQSGLQNFKLNKCLSDCLCVSTHAPQCDSDTCDSDTCDKLQS